jgi:hypothetical protein
MTTPTIDYIAELRTCTGCRATDATLLMILGAARLCRSCWRSSERERQALTHGPAWPRTPHLDAVIARADRIAAGTAAAAQTADGDQEAA